MTPVNYNNRNANNENWLPNIFNDFFSGDNWNWLSSNSKSTPAINVTEDANEYKVDVAIPGVQKEDCKVRINADTMTIFVEKQHESHEGDSKRYLRKEFSYSHFEQSFVLPDNVDQKNIKATVKDGVLSIDLPKMSKAEEENSWQNVEIN